MKKKILFYIQVPFMDINLELIRLISADHELYVLIELPTTQLRHNIFNLDVSLTGYPPLTPYQKVRKEWKLDYLAEYFETCAGVHFVTYPASGGMSRLMKTSRAVIRYIRRGKFDALHFDDFSARQAMILPFIRLKKKLIINIHDPKPHTNEFEWKRAVIKKLFYRYASHYVTFSEYSRRELAQLLPEDRILVFYLLPYSVFAKFRPPEDVQERRYISFIGRLSYYKGLDLWIDAIQELALEFPEQEFFIGGKSVFNYSPDFDRLGTASDSVTIQDKYLSNEEIAGIVSHSRLVVCPYIEATQSGIIMTAYALGCPVLVSNTGGLTEYVSDGVTGLILRETTSEEIVRKVREYLHSEAFIRMHDNLKKQVFISELLGKNQQMIQKIYGT